ncbi:c-type cytochrome [Campylobacter sp. Marseille-Q3452]|uniref:C-type cytochrome n=1 Tax=Campylobacter massiliensis TaxID=2762557 RepID=A0A842JAY7_9BACT|nr:cytochrome c peroxidase [Campylobacter massiliensis]MBC2882613.1 c-type cytochrome [Campylobacter massiliensis]
MPRAFLQIFSCVLCFFCVQAFAASHVLSPVAQPKFDEQKARLGKELFFDASLSPSGTLSCEKCHNLYWDLSGTSKKNVKISADEQISPPTALNSALNFIFFKNGEVKDLAEQVRRSLTSKNELASEPKFLIQKVNQNSIYRKKFEELYKNGVSFENIVDTLVNFEKALVTPNAKFDKFISGDESVFDDEEKHGFELFKTIGCINCHSGANMGANLYYELRFHADGNKTGRYKVPSLRNIEKTAPYFYSGEVMDLKDTIKAVGKMLLNYDLSDEQTHALYKFLLTLSGEKPEILK